jgi:putative DeoR family transcriptional regulator (stage III sporulation protein D)
MSTILHDLIQSRAVNEARYIIENAATLRKAAEEFGVSKSTVHRDIHKYLKDIDMELYEEVYKVIDLNRNERHMRGGEANRLRANERRIMEEIKMHE